MIDLAPDHLDIVDRILGEYVPDCEVRVFGSRATWTAKDYSDLDLVVVDEGPLDWRTMGRLSEAFEESRLPMRVDVLDWHSIPDRFQKEIERDYVVVRDKNLLSVLTTVPLGACARLVRESVLPSPEGKAPYIGLQHIGEGTLSLVGHGVEREVKSTKLRFCDGDILFGKLRPYFRKVIRAPFDGMCSTDIWVVRASEGVDQDFLYYNMASQDFVEFATAGSEGTRMPRAKWDHVSGYELVLPPVRVQRAVADVLCSFDDRIELNRRMYQTLEEMAQALFKSWFVDFDPVRAKMEGRWNPGESLPGLPAHLYNLFPDRLVDSELGPIPEGWRIATFGEVADELRRNVSPNDIRGSPYISLAQMPRQSITLSGWTTVTNEVVSRKLGFKKWELLFGKLRPYFHKVGVAPIDGVCSTDIVVVRPRSPGWFGFVLGHLSSTEFVHYTDTGSTGTRMPRTSWRVIANYEFVVPPEILARTHTRYLHPLIKRIGVSIHENRGLAALRDAWLPKLVSGELRIPISDTITT